MILNSFFKPFDWLAQTALHASIALLTLATAAWSATPIQTREVKFRPGESAATIQGSLRGYEIIDYKLTASAGQTMAVTLKSNHSANYFNVLPPGSKDVAIFTGSIDGSAWSGTLPANGVYTVRTYLMRSAARRNELARYTLTVSITGAPASAAATSHDDKITEASRRASGQTFDARGSVPCARHKGQPTSPCAYGVARAGGGSATVVVTQLDGRKRSISFVNFKAIGADISPADGNVEFRARKESDLYLIYVGDERYEIPEAVVTGG